MVHKTRQEITDAIINYITITYGLISKADMKPDSLISVMIEAISLEISSMYDSIDQLESQNVVSTANESYLDLIGNSIGAYRGSSDDDSYRYKIINWITNSRTSGKSAVEEAIQNNDNVYDYSIINLAYGAGTFAVHVQVKDNADVETTIAELESSIEAIVAEGVYFKVVYPKDVPVEISIIAIGSIDSQTKAIIKAAIRVYITSVKSGTSMYKANIESAIIGSSANVTTARVTSLKIDGKIAYGTEVMLLEDEQFRIDNSTITFEE